MDNFKNYFKRAISLLLALIMIITLIPVELFAQNPDSTDPAGKESVDALSSATYYTKPNWEARIRDKSRWKVEDSQTLVRVTTSDPVRMNDIDYDGMYINANGRYVIRLIYKEKTQAVSAVWHRALINFGDLDQYIDFGNSYVFGRDGKTRYTFDPVTGIKGRGFDLRSAVGDRTNNRKNLPINLVLKDGVTLDTLPKKNYIIQMRLTDANYERVYSYAPRKSSMDYSTYTKTTSVSLEDNLNNLFIKGGLQADSNNATNQEFFMSEFIANPDQYKDASNIGIIRTQYMGQRAGSAATPTVGGEPIAFTQVFDANLLNYLKEDEDGYVGYVNVLTDVREKSPYSHNFGFRKDQINTIKVDGGQELAYVVIAPAGFTNKNDVKVVGIPQHDQYTMLSGIYITAIDYVVDKSEFENTFSSKYTRKLDYSTMSGWTNPNDKGWPVYTVNFSNDYVVQEGDSFMVDAGAASKGKQIMIQVGGEQAILRRPQGYYNGYNSGKAALDKFEEIADGVFKFTIGEGTTVKSGKSLKVYMPYTTLADAPGKINFLEIHNGTKLNEGSANLTLQKDRLINMHLYTSLPRGAYFKLLYTKKGESTQSNLVFTKPKGLSTTWEYKDNDNILTGWPNKSILASGGNFYIDTTKLEPGKDIVVQAYDKDNNHLDDKTSWFKYIPLDKSEETVKLLTWTDHSDKRSVLSINKSLYTPYQVLFTNDYADGTDDFYVNPRVLPADNAKFNTDTTKIVGYTKYDSGKVRTLYEGDKLLFGKVEAAGNEYNDKGELVGQDVRKPITIAKKDIFDAQFAEDSKTYKAYEYTFDLTKMLPYHSDDKTETPLTLLKDMKFVATASDGSSLPSDLIETRVRARVLFDANTGKLTEDGNQVDKLVKIVPDNVKFYGETGYAANGFEGEGADTSTGDKFPQAPKLEGKNFLGWVTEDGKTALENKAVVTADKFNALPKEQVFTNTSPVEKHLVVYAVYSEDTVVTFDANGGTFEGGKDELTVKADETGNVTKPANPEREGFTFKGWADKKDATEANVTDFTNVTASKTVYAVWEQKDANKLTLNAPTEKVPVSDKTDLTTNEKDAVKQAVIDANPKLNLTKDDITVGSDGKVTVTKDGKTGELTPEQTVKQKEVINNINPPKKPIEVKNKESLTEEEKGKVKDAIIAANPSLNLKPEEITVGDDGTVTIDQGGKTGSVPAEKTVVEESKIIKLKVPKKVEVKDVNNLTNTEKKEVEDAVRTANPDLPNTAVISVDGNGNVTVTDGDKTGKLDASSTVKPFDRTGKTLNDPKELTEVSDINNLTQAEKQAVKEAVKEANPDLAFKNNEIQVDNNGKVTVPMGTDGTGKPIYQSIEPSKTVKLDDAAKTISLKAPEVTFVVNPKSLTGDEKDAVKDAVIKANPSIATGYDITVADDGSVTVTQGEGENKKTGMLAQADTVVKKLDPPKTAKDEDGAIVVGPKDYRTKEIEVTYTDPDGNDQTVIAKKDSDGKWKLDPEVDGVSINEDSGLISIPAGKIKNGTDVKAVAKDGDNTSDESTITSEDKKAPAAPSVVKNDDGSVSVTPPTDKDAKTVTISYTDPKGNEKTVTATKGDDGKWKLADGTDNEITINENDGKVTIPQSKTKPGTRVSATATDGNNNTSSSVGVTTASMADDNEPKIPAKTIVANPNKLTQKEKDAVKKAIEDANKDNNGESTFPKPGEKQDPTKVEVGDDGAAIITYPDGSQDKITGYRLVEKDKVAPAAPTVKANDDGSVSITPPTDADTKTVEVTYTPEGKTDPVTVTATKDPDTGKWSVPEGSDVTVDENSGVITLPANKVANNTEVSAVAKDRAENESTPTDTSKATAKTPAGELNDPSKVAVKDPANLTPEEKQAIKDAVKKANPGLTDAQIAVDKEGNVTVTKDGEDPKTISKDKTVSKDVKTPTPTEVVDKTNLTDDEKAAVKKAVEDANKDGSGNSTLPEGATITVGNDGTVTVKDKDGKETIIPASNTVKQKAGTPGAELKDPSKVAVKDPANLTDGEKQAIKDAVKKANSTLKDSEIVVNADGSVTVTKDGKETTIGKDKTVSKDVKTPELTEVTDKTNLTDDEKAAVKKAVEDANKDGSGNSTLPEGATITVGNDGTVTIKDKDGKETIIPASNTVTRKGGEKLADKLTPAYTEADAQLGRPTTIIGPNFTDKNGADATKPEGTSFALGEGASTGASIDENGKITYTPSEDDAGKTITIPVLVKYSDGSTDTVNVTIKVAPKAGTEVKAPATPVEVDNSKALSDEDKEKVKQAVENANKDSSGNSTLPQGATIDVADDGTVTIKDKDGNPIGTIPADKTVKQNDSKLAVAAPNPVEVADPENVTEEEQGKIKEAVKKANPDLNLEDTDITVDDKGNVTVTKDSKTGSLAPGQTIKKAGTGINTPENPITVDNSKSLTDNDKKAVEDAIRKANPSLPADARIEVADDGAVTIKDKDGNVIGTIPADKTVKQDDSKLAVAAPNPVEVADPENLTKEEQDKIKAAIIAANPDLADATITVDRKGNVTITKDGKTGTIPSEKTITQAKPYDPDANYPGSDNGRGGLRNTYPLGINRDLLGSGEKTAEEEVTNKETLIHRAYIFGYPDGTVRPNGKVTRAEAATMLVRLLEIENSASADKPAFSDTLDNWYNKSINAVLAREIMKGYPDGTFKPNEPITRAEFAQMISKIDEKPFGKAPFADVVGHWAENAIGKEYAAGRIAGYPDGTFRPDEDITRAEAAKILNMIFERNYDSASTIKSKDKNRIKTFTDLSTDFWGYNDMMEATNTHLFMRRDKGLVPEDWSEINR